MTESDNHSFVSPTHSEQSQGRKPKLTVSIENNCLSEMGSNRGSVQLYQADQAEDQCPLQNLTLPNTNLLPVQFCPNCPQHQEGYHEVSVQEPECSLSPSQINVISMECNQCPQDYEVQQYVEVPDQQVAVRCCRTISQLSMPDAHIPVTYIDKCDESYLNVLGLQSVGSGDSQTTVTSIIRVKRRSSSSPPTYEKKQKTCKVILDSSLESDERCSETLASKIAKLLVNTSTEKSRAGKK